MTTVDFLSISKDICPERVSIIFDGKSWTYEQLDKRSNQLARALVGLGAKRGETIGIIEVNCNQYIESYFAVAKLGAFFVPLNFRAKAEELTYMINHAEIKILLFGKRYLELIKEIRPHCQGLKDYISIGQSDGAFIDYEELLSSASSDEISEEIAEEDITIIMYTSGTTGRPKAVPIRHNAFVSYVLENVDPPSPEIEERNLLSVPFYHIAGMQSMLSSIYGGRTIVLMRQFDVDEWLKTVERERVNRSMLVPTMLKRIIDHPEFGKYNLSSLKVITYGAAPMPFEVITKAINMLPWVRFINAFGQTETASTITALGPEDHIIEGPEEEKEKKLKRLSSSIGRPLPDVEIKIVDEDGKALPPNKIGEIWARGPRVMTGYWRDEQKTAEAITPDGWLRTGDMGWMDEDGYIYLSGRADDMIIRGGENISPEEVEDVIESHPKVEEAAVIGVPDPEWGQEPRAIVVVKKGETVTAEEIIEHCRSRLAGFKRPRSVIFVPSLPRNPMGKLLRKKLREEYGQP